MYVISGDYSSETGKAIGNWYAEKTQMPLVGPLLELIGPFSAIGFIDSEGTVQFALIYTNYNGSNINLHAYGPKGMNKSILKIMLHYPFNELNCSRVTAIVPRSNKKTLRLLPRLNFVYETVLKSYFGNKKEQKRTRWRCV